MMTPLRLQLTQPSKRLQLISAALLVLTIILIVCLIASKRRRMSIRYLNVNSTLAPRTGYYNPSDLGYRNMRILRTEKEAVFNEIKRFVNAPKKARVILVSGATEAIATCVNWAKRYNKYGAIYGTSFDHTSIRANVENQEMEYKLLDDELTNASALFLTHVNSRTGEILPDEYLTIGKRITTKLNPELSDNASDKSSSNSIFLNYKPLIFIDATQSITKIPIDMSAMKADALFFSMHKIGGPMNLGVLVISEKSKPFVPFIAGTQNDGLRGGTMNETEFVENRDVFKYEPSPSTREEAWNDAVKRLEAKGVRVERPKYAHLYNTIVASVKGSCPLSVIDKLYSKSICVGTLSACSNEPNEAKPNDELSGGAKSQIRISFMNASDIDDNVIDTIAEEIINEIN